MKNGENPCAEGCILADAFEDIKKELVRAREVKERSDEDTKANFSKFERKQDQILDVLSDYKVLLNEIKNLKTAQEKLEETILRENNNAREQAISIFERLNELEKSKADKSEAQEGKSWLWGLVLLVLSVLANFLVDMLFRGHK